jgi:hypothetical protein
MKFMTNAQPHPNPLPWGEGTARCDFRKSIRRGYHRRTSEIHSLTHEHVTASACTQPHGVILPLLGERIGVRAVVTFPN